MKLQKCSLLVAVTSVFFFLSSSLPLFANVQVKEELKISLSMVYNKEKIEKYVQGVTLGFFDMGTRNKIFLFYTSVPLCILQPGCSLRDTGNWYLELLSQPFPPHFLFPTVVHRPRSQKLSSPRIINVCIGESYWGRSAGIDKEQRIDVSRCPRHSSTEAEYGGVRVNRGHYLLCLTLSTL